MACPSSSAAAALTLARSVTSNANDPQFVVARISQSAQLGSGTWITTRRVNLPTLGQILSGELKPESAIGTCDQSAWHRMLHWSPMPESCAGPSLVRRHAFLREFFDRLLVL